MLLLVDEAKKPSRGREIEVFIQRRKASVRTRLFLDFLETFSMKNKGFEVLKTEKGLFLDFLKTFSMKNK